MKLTRQQETELMQVYETWWNSYLNGDVKTYDSFLADDYHFVGSTNGEEYLNRKDTTAFFDATADQLAGKAELRNLKRTIEELNVGLILITDLADAYVISEPEWVFYSRFRFTSLMKETPNGWRFIYQHFSAPDTKAQEGETLGTAQISKENQELRDAIKRRTVELENKTRELEIEAALERVRNRTLLMKDSSELNEAAAVFFQQLQTLSLLPPGARTYFCHINPETAVAEVWMTHANGSVMQGSHQTPLNNSPSLATYFDAWKRKKPINVRIYTGDSLKEYLQFISSLPHVKVDKDYQQLLSSPPVKIVMTDANFLQGNIGVMTLEPLSPEALDILTRFAKVFEFTYTRFLDLQKAEAQSREAQIEAALERVRSSAMAMHTSESLLEVIHALREQMAGLGEKELESILIHIYNEKKEEFEAWYSYRHTSDPNGKIIHGNVLLNWTKTERACKDKEKYYSAETDYTIVADYKMLKEWYEYLEIVVPEVVEYDEIGKILIPDALYYNYSKFSGGAMLLITNKEASDDSKHLLKRSAEVFNLAFTRFLDLQKAEAQAREAQIEVALERTRTQSMIMQHSDEIKNISAVFHQQLLQLNIPSEFSYVWLPDEEKNDHQFWASWAEDVHGEIVLKSKQVTYPLDKTEPYTAACFAVWEKPELVNIAFIPPVEIPTFFNTWQELLDGAENLKAEFFQDGIYYAEAYMRYGCFGINIRHEISAEEKQILKRFSVEFERAYTRFLDLQKAEAQTRESQIELGLERVRARAMAMQHSNELSDLVDTVFKELTKLDFAISMCIINIIDESNLSNMVWAANPDTGKPPDSYNMRFEDYPFHHAIMKGYKERSGKFIYVIEGEEKKIYDKYLFNETEFSKMPLEAQAASKALEKYVSSFSFSNFGGLQTVGEKPLSDSNLDILARFGKVFDLTYTRFNDLKQAEAQAKEAKIEAALERVRSHSLAMQKSEELKDVIQVVYDQFIQLNIQIEHTGFIMDYKEREDMQIWLADQHAVPFQVTIPYFDCAHWNSFKEAKAIGRNFFADHLSFEEKNKFYQDLFKLIPGVPEETMDYYLSCPGLAISTVLLDNVGLYIENFSGTSFTNDENNTLMRFGKVFQQTYTRFRDLQKAEAQAREAQIELSLERIRSQVMAMRESADLLDIVVTMRAEFVSLGHEAHYFWHMRWLPETYDKAMTSGDGTRIGMVMKLPRHIHGDIQLVDDWEKSEEPTLILAMDVETAVDYIEKMINLGDFEQVDPNAPTIDDIRHIGGLTFIMARTTHGEIGYSLPGMVPEPSAEGIATLARFAGVFDLAYKRFEDLKIREEKNRETLIELAMEKVRTKTMAMQHSDELPEAANVLFLEVQNLGIPAWSCGYNILSADKKSSFCIMSSEGELQIPFTLPLTEHESFLPWYEAIINGDDFFVYGQGGEELADHYRYMKTLPELKPVFKQFEDAGISLPTFQINHLARFKQGFLLFITYQPVPEAHDIFKRFAILFEQTYTRFLDLQKAEAQTREAQINLAVERVRAKALAMFKSEEILQVVNKLKEEIMGLDIPNVIAATIHLKENDGRCRIWDISSVEINEEALHHPMDIRFKLEDTDPNFFMRRIWENTNNYFVEMQDENDLKRTIQWLRNNDRNQQADETEQFIENTKIKKLYHPTIKLYNGRMCIDLLEAPEPEIASILEKMGAAFDLSYRRFEDLKNSEAQLKESQIEAALEKVRSRTLAMQKSDELADTSAVLFKQLINLGIEPNRLYITVMKDDNGDAEFWITDENGSKVSAAYRDNLNLNPTFKKMLDDWKAKEKSLVIDIQGAELEEYFMHLASLNVYFKDGLKQKRRIQHLAYFNHGFIGMASPDEQPESTMHLLERFAAVFNLTYTRFNDLKIAEAHAIQAEEDLVKLQTEKKRAEEALNELQSAQKQLIQSEKMASLGELTAGIAHEIQNPLNFVNNFSEVSKELLDEMQAAIKNGDDAEVKIIIQDVILNLEKINLHGKRADAIVKGMLQHSRSNNGIKELTDINSLADEYLRLAYHGLRAKDKSFNATLKTDFDEGIDSFNIIPQDIGRVILNLITNAFYVVTEKKKENIAGYEPIVFLSTRRLGDKIEIKVTDNGNGIPQNILDKIFQPFFTTKPTGQGTGLGLSLSYDIVKAHGGEINVSTVEGKGTAFVIKLSVK